MLFIRNNLTRLRQAGLILNLFLLSLCWSLRASEEPALLTLIPKPGLIVLDDDTLQIEGPTEIEISPGEHILRFFPLHTAGEWVHRYLVYPFTVGSSGHKMIDLSKNAIFRIRAEPQRAELYYRGHFLGRTPGDYFLLLGTGDSVVVSLAGYQRKAIYLDEVFEQGTDVFVTLEPEGPEILLDDLQTSEYISPLRQVLSADLLFCLGSGTALLASGVHFNRLADKHYDRYLRLLGTRAREKAYSKARKNDRLSKASFIAGDIAIAAFGYLLIRRFIFKSEKAPTSGKKSPRLSVITSPGKSGLALRF